jgi:hypothetical protein
MRTHGLRALARTSRERALASRLELTAFQQGADVIQFADAAADASTALWFDTRHFGLKLGMAEGLGLRTSDGAEWALAVAMQTGSAITQFTALAPEDLADHPPETVKLPATNGWLLTCTRERFREVLLLGPSYDETLAMLGRHTRRNIRNARKAALSKNLAFTFWSDGSGMQTEARVALGRNMQPYPLTETRMRRLEAYADAAGQPFRSVLQTAEGQAISYSCGYIDRQTAYLVYQLNDSEWSALGPSLMNRAFLMEALINLGCREIVFVHGCSGILMHACIPMTLDRYVVVRDSALAHAAVRLIRKLRPKSRIVKVLNASLTAVAPEAGGNLGGHDGQN